MCTRKQQKVAANVDQARLHVERLCNCLFNQNREGNWLFLHIYSRHNMGVAEKRGELQRREDLNLAQRSCKGLVGAVKPGSELGADASSEFGSAETLDGVLSHFTLPLWSDGRRVHKRYPMDYLQGDRIQWSGFTAVFFFLLFYLLISHGWTVETLTCLICSQTNRVTEDPEWKVTSTW